MTKIIAVTACPSGVAHTYVAAEALESALAQTPADGALAQAEYYRDKVIPAMTALRSAADQLEPLVDKALWPFPTYSDLLFSVN